MTNPIQESPCADASDAMARCVTVGAIITLAQTRHKKVDLRSGRREVC
jgi:hypothetical protein